MGMPQAIGQCCTEFFTAGSVAFSMYPALTIGALNLIRNFGTQEMKDLYIPKMITGQWTGTMCLTEPDAGSDVGNLKTRAIKLDDGTYKIIGQKIFISGGDYDMPENIIHPVLARIEGDPPGTKGISIFIVPKYRVKADGSLEFNDVVCSGIEHKMGIKASATCSLSFGDTGDCIGWLLGKERQGMKIMFQMMNEARLYVGLQGLAVSSAAYMHAITYARNRVQGVHVSQMLNPDAPKVSIIQHPDVKRMLLWMKSYVEGMRLLTYYVGYQEDLAHALDGEAKKEAQAMIEILIPITKAGNTDNAWKITSEAIQVYGGYGFCSDYPVEQFARDSKILSIYEGTNGIQSMDLAMRKILMNPEQYNYNVFKKRVQETISRAKGIVDDKYVDIVQKGLEKVDVVVNYLKDQMAAGKFLHIFASATPLQQAMSMFVLAWMHLWMLSLTQPKMKELIGDKKGDDLNALLADNSEAAYYNGKVLSSQFYLGAEFKKFFGMVDYIIDGEAAVVKASEHIFTGAPLE
jgi:alkylation response protein AidB-like acyl-CoA dehydrogenase